MMNSWSRVARRIRVPTGFLFAAFYLWRARPSATSLASSLLLVAPGLLLRACASGYVKKNAELTVTGPYAYTRNPLYLGSILMAFGFAAASRSVWAGPMLSTTVVIPSCTFIRSSPRAEPAKALDGRLGARSGDRRVLVRL